MKYRPTIYDPRIFDGNALTWLLVKILPVRWIFGTGWRQRLITWAYGREWERGLEPFGAGWLLGYTIFGGEYGGGSCPF